MRNWTKKLTAALVFVIILGGGAAIYFWVGSRPDGLVAQPQESATVAPATHGKAEAEAIYQQAQAFFEAGNVADEKKSYEALLQKFPNVLSEVELEGDALSYGDLARSRLPQLGCALEHETGGDNAPERSEEQLLDELLAALAKSDRAKLLTLISCSVREGVPSSEYDQTDRETAVEHLLGERSGDGYGSIAKGSKPFAKAGKHEGLHMISNGEQFVGFMIAAPPHSPKTHRVQWILWGNPED